MLNEGRKYVAKGWGYEDWIWNDEKYCGKLLVFEQDKRCSWHYHKDKDETFYLASGRLLLVYSNEDCVNAEGSLLVCSYVTDLLPQAKHWFQLAQPPWAYSGGAHAIILDPGDSFHVSPGRRHQMFGLLDSEMFEFSTTHFDEDSIRVLKGD